MSTKRRKKKEFTGRLKRVRLNRVDKAVLETLCYRAVFNYPFSLSQICHYLISKDSADVMCVKGSLKKLVSKRKVKVYRGLYHLSGVRPVNRKYRIRVSKKLVKKAGRIAEILGKVPWVRMIAVTGSVAAYSASKKSDIDVFIVAKKNRVWLTRGFVISILKVMNQYRTDKDESKKICPNIFVDESRMTWEKEKRSIYVANDVVMMIPLVNKDNTYLKFMRQNSWAYNYFGNMKQPLFELKMEKVKTSLFGSLLEFLAFRAQLRYMKDKKTDEITTKHFIHFKKFDNTKKVLSDFEDLKSRFI